ncbi:MAG: hypothetical protein Q7S26_03620 [bacterium]|nr:hypothetical protein [bacterium]
MKNEVRKATDRRWLLEVFGKSHAEPLQDFASALAEEYDVEIHVRLTSEKVHLEGFSSDD